MRAISETTGEIFALMAYVDHDSVAAGSKSDNFSVTSHDKVISAHWYFDPADKARLSFQLVTPAGTFSTLSPSSDINEGYALIEVDNSDGRHNGAARAVVLASASVANPIGLDVQSESAVELVVDLEGGLLGDTREPVLRAQFRGSAPITKAQLLATITHAETGAVLLKDLVLLDDGKGLDARADDGRYTLSLRELLAAGDYTITVRAVTTAESVFQANQIFARGTPIEPQPVGAGLVRVDVTDTTLQEGSVGVKPTVTGVGDGGGGCTSVDGRRDAGLVLLMGLAVLGLLLRRRGIDEVRRD
jgi:hypothetical protein